jgi:hypothetical protein
MTGKHKIRHLARPLKIEILGILHYIGMTAPPSMPSLFRRCAEAIALLAALGDVPSAPTRYAHQAAINAAGYELDLRTERDQTSTLGFLSSIRDDINNITAVLVREDERGISILVASNAATAAESAYLSSVKSGFDRIFEVIREMSRSTYCCPLLACLLHRRLMVVRNRECEARIQSVFEAIMAICREKSCPGPDWSKATARLRGQTCSTASCHSHMRLGLEATRLCTWLSPTLFGC